MMKHLNLLLILILVVSTTATAQNRQSEKEMKVMATLQNFHQAIMDNNQQLASNLLTEDALILESGGVETKKRYLSHHFHSDGKFLDAMEREMVSQRLNVTKATAWISTLSKMSGIYDGRNININSAELAVLVSTDDGWKISAMHWSSRSIK